MSAFALVPALSGTDLLAPSHSPHPILQVMDAAADNWRRVVQQPVALALAGLANRSPQLWLSNNRGGISSDLWTIVDYHAGARCTPLSGAHVSPGTSSVCWAARACASRSPALLILRRRAMRVRRAPRAPVRLRAPRARVGAHAESASVWRSAERTEGSGGCACVCVRSRRVRTRTPAHAAYVV